MKRLFAALIPLVVCHAAVAGSLSKIVQVAQEAVKSEKDFVLTKANVRATEEFRAQFPARNLKFEYQDYMLGELKKFSVVGTTADGSTVLLGNRERGILEVMIARKVNQEGEILVRHQIFLDAQEEARKLSFALNMRAVELTGWNIKSPNFIVSNISPQRLTATNGQNFFLTTFEIEKAARMKPAILEEIISGIVD